MRSSWLVLLSFLLLVIAGHAQQSPQATHTNATSDPSIAAKIKPPVANCTQEPKYPEEAEAKGLNGRCSFLVTIDAAGKQQDIKLIRCTDPVFAANLSDAVAKCRYKPARTEDGKPVTADLTTTVSLARGDGGREPHLLVSAQFRPIPGATSLAPDTNGVYPMAAEITSPRVKEYVDAGYLEAAFENPGNSPCDVLLTINAKGKASDAQVLHCDKPFFDKLASQSLLGSRFVPGSFNGSPVSVRTSVHLEFGGIAPPK